MLQMRFRRRFAVLFLLLAVLLSACSSQTGEPSGGSSRPAGSTDSRSEISLIESVTSADEEAVTYVTCTEEDLHRGNLLLVNRSHAYDASLCAGEITSVRASRVSDIQEGTYQLPIGGTLLQALEAMQADLRKAMNDNVCLLVNDSYRSAETQQATIDEYLELYGQAYVDQYVAPVGRSEHHTSLAVDFSFYEPSNGTVMATTSAEAAAHYAWVLDNCRKYGLILRYTTEKEAVTGYRAESWHFRYVGRPHADYIAAHGLALEEYLQLLKGTSFEQQLSIEIDNGEKYSVYYVPAVTGGTKVPVPADKPYTLSGNNADGFIVTVTESGK